MRSLINARNPSRRHAVAALGLTACMPWLSSSTFAQATTASKTRRIVSVGGALTEIVYALQAGGDLVGVDTTSTFPDIARKLPSVGYARALSVEGVLALAPTQIIATEDAGPPTVMRQLNTSGIPVAVLAANHRFEGLLERVKKVGELTDRVPQAASLMLLLQQDWERAQTQVKAQAAARLNTTAGKPIRVLFVLAHSPNQIMVAERDTSAQAVIDYVGATNAINAFTGYKPLTPEAVIAAQPDVVLLTEQGSKASGGIEGALKLPGIEQTPAGQQRRVVALDAMLLLGFGPRLPAAVAALDAALTKAMRV